MTARDGNNTKAPNAGTQISRSSGSISDFFMFFIMGLFEEMGLGPSSNRNFENDMRAFANPEELVRSRVFIESIQNEDIRRELTENSNITSVRASEIVSMSENREAALRASVSRGFELYTEDGEDRGVRYGFGVKNGVRAVDCSGAVSLAIRSASGVAASSCGIAFSNALMGNMSASSEEQIAAAERAGATVLTNNQINMGTLRAGMIIGMDTGRTRFDAGRQRGIDHIVMVYRDSETGKLMIGQSSSGEGVHATEASEWLQRNQRHKLYAVDMVPLAQTERDSSPTTRIASIDRNLASTPQNLG